MTSVYSSPGFDFSNTSRYLLYFNSSSLNSFVGRNNFLAEKGIPLPKATSTGTTIVGCLFKDGIVLGADTRATEGPIVADKNCEKVSLVLLAFSLHALIPNGRSTTLQRTSVAVVQAQLLTQNLRPQ